MRAGFTSNVLTFLTCTSHFFNAFRAADMANVQTATGNFRQIQHAANRFHFGKYRTRSHIVMGSYATFTFRFFAQCITDQCVFAVHQHRLPQFAQLLRTFEELPVVYITEVVVDTAIATGRNEAFEADNAHFIQLMQTVDVVRHQATELCRIDSQLAFSGIELQFN